jgi:hypothetical protein
MKIAEEIIELANPHKYCLYYLEKKCPYIDEWLCIFPYCRLNRGYLIKRMKEIGIKYPIFLEL